MEVTNVLLFLSNVKNSNMQIQLTNANTDQLKGLMDNFGSDMIVTEGDDKGKFNVLIEISTELQAWKLFFSGSDYCLAKFGKHVTS